tara:strand:+ start:2499 stop:2759 length:261 start_codon:yes stop_codon:yes gene_type:complete
MKYIDRYSSTDQFDFKGRWARVVVYKDIQIAWISKFKATGDNLFFVDNKFPTMYNDSARETEAFKTLYEAKEFVEERWEWFINHVE